MNIEAILHHVEPGADLTISNEPFSFKSKALITLEGGDIRHWLFSEEGLLLAISPEDEEFVFMRELEEVLEPEEEVVLYGGKEYEFSYEDKGSISEVEGDWEGEEEDTITFSDYEAEDGEVVRLITNEDNGETSAYLGKLVVEDDIVEV